MTVIGAAGAVLAGGATELAHGDEGDVFRFVAHIEPEGGDRVGELLQAVGELTGGGALIDVGVPATDVGEGRFDAEVGLQELSDLLERVAEGRVGIGDVSGGLVACGVGGLEHADGFEGLLAGAMEASEDSS